MIVKTYQAAAALAIAAAVGFGIAATRSPGDSAATVHALAVPAEQIAGPCAGMPALDAANLSFVFAPAGEKGAQPVKVVDASTFTVTYGPATYTVKLADDGGATADGPDAASAALLARHASLCTGAVGMTAEDVPGQWTAAGTYVPMAAAVTSDR